MTFLHRKGTSAHQLAVLGTLGATDAADTASNASVIGVSVVQMTVTSDNFDLG